jgi:hypothetical protein
MTENIMPTQMMDYQLQGIRSPGRPRKRWQDKAWGATAFIGAYCLMWKKKHKKQYELWSQRSQIYQMDIAVEQMTIVLKLLSRKFHVYVVQFTFLNLLKLCRYNINMISDVPSAVRIHVVVL